MALSAGLIYEVRPGGNANNGAGFNPATGGTDYTQQDNHIWTANNLSCSTGSTTITSASGGIPSDVPGNLIKIISGTNFTANYYEILTRPDEYTITVDRSPCPSADGSSGVGYIGGASNDLSVIDGHLVAGNKVWIKSGSYAELFDLPDGTVGSMITVEGYWESRGDHPISDNRPLFSNITGSYHTTGDYTVYKHIRFRTGLTSYTSKHNIIVKFCEFITSDIGIQSGGASILIYCSTFIKIGSKVNSGVAIGHSSPAFTPPRGAVIGCYFENWAYGLQVSAINQVLVQDCIFNNCTQGVRFPNTLYDEIPSYFSKVMNCTFLNCTYAWVSTFSYYSIMSNCIIDTATYGLYGDSDVSGDPPYIYSYSNHFYSVTTPLRIALDLGNTELSGSDPKFLYNSTDYRLDETSPCLSTGHGTGVL